MNKLAFLLAAMLFAGSGSALASGGADLRMEPAPVNRLDAAVAAARRPQFRQLLPQLPQRQVHALCSA